MQKRGDWSWNKAVNGLCGWGGEGAEQRCCFTCRISLGDIGNFAMDAAWRFMLMTDALFLAEKLSSDGYVFGHLPDSRILL